MKQFFRFFTLLLVAAVTSASAWAIDVPKPKAKPLTVGAEVYIMNVGSGKYVGQGESWSTQSVVNETGLKYIVKNKKDDGSAIRTDEETGEELFELPEGQYWLYSPDIVDAAGHSIDRWNDGTTGDGIKCCFSDQVDWDERGIWQITLVGDNTYKFTVPEGLTTFLDQQNAYVEGEALGVQNDHASSWTNANGATWGLYHDVVYADAPEMCQFQFIDAVDMEIYKVKLTLAKMCDDAKEVDVDASAYEALILNENATLEEVNAAIEELETKLKAADTWNYPTDITDQYIVNPNPYEGHMDGWTVLDGAGKPATEWGGDPQKIGNWWIGEFWSSAGYSMSQTIHIPKGVYTLRLYALTRTGMNAVLKVGENQTYIARFSSGDVNNRAGANTLFNNGKGINDVSWVQLEDGDIEISLTADSKTADYWLPYRNFMLLDRGYNMRSFQNAAKSLAEGWEDEFMEENEEGEVVPSKVFTQSYFDAVKAAVESVPTSTNTEEAYAIYVQVQEALNTLRKNAELYAWLEARVTETSPLYEDPFWDMFGGNLAFDDTWKEAFNIFYDEDYTKTNEYLQDLIDRYKSTRENAIYEVIEMANEGESVKGYIVNPEFKNEDKTAASFDGWTVESSSTFQNNAGNVPVIEQWNGSGNMGVIRVYQKVAIRKVGAYRLKTKGWYRSTTNSDTHMQEGYNTVNTYLYGASSEYKFHDIYEHPYTPEEKMQYFPKGNLYGPTADNAGATYDGPGEKDPEDYLEELQLAGFETVYPNNCTGANELFNNPDVTWYDMTCDFLGLGVDSPVEIGVKGDDIPGYAWLIWDDFDMIYLGSKLSDMQPIAQVAADDASAEFADPTIEMSAKSRNAVAECIATLSNPADVDALVAAYKALDPARVAARNSIKLYKKMRAKLDELSDEISARNMTASEEALNNADDLAGQMDIDIAAGNIDDEDVDAAIAQMDKAIRALKMPKNMNEASDDNVIDCTDLITNPRFFAGGTANLDGWTMEGGNGVQNEDDMIGYAEGWGGSDSELETSANNHDQNASFDCYQILTDMPAGTYHLIVNGLFRPNGVADAFKMVQYGYAEKLGKLDWLDEAAKTDVREYEERGEFYGNNSVKKLARWLPLGTDEWNDELADKFIEMGQSSGNFVEYVDSLSGDSPEETVSYYVPNDRASLWLCAQSDLYDNDLYCQVGDDGILRIGACNKHGKANDWTPFSNWRLYYHGANSSHETDAIYERTVETGTVEAIYTVDGRLTNRLEKGLNIVKTRTADGKVIVKKVLVK